MDTCPYYCIECRKQIPKSLSDAQKVCDDCLRDRRLREAFKQQEEANKQTVRAGLDTVKPMLIKTSGFTCKLCGGALYKSSEGKSGGIGCIVLLLGILLIPILIGIPAVVYGLHLMMKREGLWVCGTCGAKTPRKLAWFEYG